MFGEPMCDDRRWTQYAHAKVNVALYVGTCRPDGYHPVATVIQRLELHDRVEFGSNPVPRGSSRSLCRQIVPKFRVESKIGVEGGRLAPGRARNGRVRGRSNRDTPGEAHPDSCRARRRKRRRSRGAHGLNRRLGLGIGPAL